MKMIYKKGLCVVPLQDEIIDLSKETILSWQILKLKNWNSPDLIIRFENGIFQEPVGMILNYNEVIKFLKLLNK